MNIYDIAKRAGVSPATVSRVMNGNNSVKAETRKRIMQIVEETNYVPNSLARSLSVGDTNNIAFFAPDIENPFFSKILHGLSDTANRYGYNVFMYGTNENLEVEHRILAGLRKEMVKGIVFIPVSDCDKRTAELLERLEKRRIPVVLLDRDISQYHFDGVFSDDYEGAKSAVRCLIDAGHRKIGMVTGPEDTRPGRERSRGYRHALADAGIAFREDYMLNGHFKEQESYEACRQLLEHPDRPTAIFAGNNMTTLGCLKCINDKGLKLGKDISIVCFDEIHELECVNIHLTTVDRPVYEMGSAAMELLEYNFNLEEKPGTSKLVRRTTLVQTKLVVRGSERLNQE